MRVEPRRGVGSRLLSSGRQCALGAICAVKAQKLIDSELIEPLMDDAAAQVGIV